MQHIKEFSRFAWEYQTYNVVQKQVAFDLVSMIKGRYETIVDLGCGSGALYALLGSQVKHFIAVDLSLPMLELHPDAPSIEKYAQSFDAPSFWEYLPNVDLLVSASSVQWSSDLAQLFEHIASRNKPFALALFTSETFKTLHETAEATSPLRPAKEVRALASDILGDIQIIQKSYELTFSNTKELFSYIKKSGVSGANKQLSFTQTKALYNNYPHSKLEFEVLFICSTGV